MLQQQQRSQSDQNPAAAHVNGIHQHAWRNCHLQDHLPMLSSAWSRNTCKVHSKRKSLSQRQRASRSRLHLHSHQLRCKDSFQRLGFHRHLACRDTLCQQAGNSTPSKAKVKSCTTPCKAKVTPLHLPAASLLLPSGGGTVAVWQPLTSCRSRTRAGAPVEGWACRLPRGPRWGEQ